MKQGRKQMRNPKALDPNASKQPSCVTELWNCDEDGERITKQGGIL